VIYCFDIDGTISARPKIFKEIMLGLKKLGHTVYPLTGMVLPASSVMDDLLETMRHGQLEALGLKKGEDYDDVVIVLGKNLDDCGQLKGKFCKEHRVDFMVDDTQLYVDGINEQSPDTLVLKMPNGL